MEKITISHEPAKLLDVPILTPGIPGITDDKPRVVKPPRDIFQTKAKGGANDGTD